MSLYPTTFGMIEVTSGTLEVLDYLNEQATKYAATLDQALDDGPDKDYILRHLRETAMWVSVALYREADGTPRV
jgi:hypothetical protein